jgi:hypothetical protein
LVAERVGSSEGGEVVKDEKADGAVEYLYGKSGVAIKGLRTFPEKTGISRALSFTRTR